MWRDVRGKVIQFYMTLFSSYEHEGLQIDNVWHIFTLQYMFMIRIQEELNDFKQYWNHHPIESENNRTPIQLILLRNNSINYDVPLDLENYDVGNNIVNDINQLDNVNENIQQVICEPIKCPLSPANLSSFKQQISPLNKYVSIDELSDRFHHALNLVLDLRDSQIN